MTILNNSSKVQVAKVIAKNLILRNSANELFNFINGINEFKIFMDFEQVKSITRSFAHQYLKNKINCEKDIIDINVSSNIKNMFELIRKKM